MRITMETAGALNHLHASDIIHTDIKTSNILLDAEYHVKVADFGLSRHFPNDQSRVLTIPQGTYVDPEYNRTNALTYESDVFSFGVVLIELITSLCAYDHNRKDDVSICMTWLLTELKIKLCMILWIIPSVLI
ncbi:LEAF RUST 10 DISEASE-RESISTANCE LOCUS RECEPTOR-LIKE PROTEIN KINASE-like 1.1 [Vicia villosa]|uniref:LEAF RUST 10 DISEASE-RESISTANCE LOCUS RECEPTOR-LIKE PROTEIN KINASE-like 1.1 n=1 Tax=Vicia villosa TaxID=3911 RepID=UPI00273B167B|nr:LEAF RUST 10 DISEASE-RESISTANCE LOCUS RECEPTOR-LIKE PROTEIN KINASE-like 1.1 [Vicia villosa]